MNPQQSSPDSRSQGKLPAKGRRPSILSHAKSLILWSVNPNVATPTNPFPSLPLLGDLSSGEDREVPEEHTPYRVSDSPNEPQNQTDRESQAMVEGKAQQGRTHLYLFLIHKLLIVWPDVLKQFQSPYHTSIPDYLASGSSPSSAMSSGPSPNPSYMQGEQLPSLRGMGGVHVSRGADNPFTYNDPVEATLNECAAAEEAKMRGQKKLLQLDTEIERMERNLRAEKKRREK